MKKIRDFPNTVVLLGLIGAAFIASLFQEVGGAMSGVITQLGLCEQGNSICLLSYWSITAFVLVLFGIFFDLWLKRKMDPDQELKQKQEEAIESPPTILDRFSFHLDEITKDKNISGLGKSFLENIKTAPPFLGIRHSQPVIPFGSEQKLTEHFLAKQFIETNRKYIRGKKPYLISGKDTHESIAENIYGDVKFASLVKSVSFTLPNGSYIGLPYIDISASLGLSSKDIEEKLSVAQNSWIEPALKGLMDQFNLIKDETLPIMKMIYDAAKITLNEKVNAHKD